MALHVCENIIEDFSVIINKLISTKYPISILYLIKWWLPTILNPFLKKYLGSFSKSYLKLKLSVVKLLKLNIEKPWFDYQDTRCCRLAIQCELPYLLPGPNPQFHFMKNSVHTSLLWSLYWPYKYHKLAMDT